MVFRIFKRRRGSKSMMGDMHKEHGKPTMEGKPMAGHGSMTETQSMEEMPMMEEMPLMDHKPMSEDMAMGGHAHREHSHTDEPAFSCPACGAGFPTQAELEEHGRSAH